MKGEPARKRGQKKLAVPPKDHGGWGKKSDRD